MARGNITPRTRQLVDALNDCLGRGEHREMFHHSDDAGNPGSIWVTTSRPPSTFPGPWSIGSEKSPFASTRSAWWRIGRAFSLLVECIKGNGYHFTAHPDWNVPLRPSFQEALDFFQRKV
ncbi:adenylate cyclase [Pseudomonas aeruginosa]|nr:adenylate cyclase [Pseudomonas aeruginosa]